jgi:hypothetical protein
MFTISNMNIWIISAYKVFLVSATCSVIIYDEIDDASRDTFLRPWENLSCFKHKN